MLHAARRALRGSCFCEEPRVHGRGGALDCARHRGEHVNLQRRERAAAAPASLSERRPARHSLEPLAGVGHHGGLVLHGAVLRRQDRPSGVRAGRDCDRRQRQPDGRRRAGADRHDPRVLEPAADARRARGARTPVRRRRGPGGRPGHRGARSCDVDAPVRRRSERGRHVPPRERAAVSDRRRAAGVLRAASRGDADAERRRARRARAPAAARPEGRRVPRP